MAGITLRSFAEGNESGPTVFFVHGWPDDHTLWDAQASTLTVEVSEDRAFPAAGVVRAQIAFSYQCLCADSSLVGEIQVVG